MARRLRLLLVMSQVQNAIMRKFKELPDRLRAAAGQKARGGWQTLPGARLMEVRACL
ncbi:hypothetical protein [Brevundimonas sp. FT23028]|uniref:hypothetical protein n=1 Tax=Brevundimonas sp. FT23028 TaxID=3393748 RepID=UPI003B588941